MTVTLARHDDTVQPVHQPLDQVVRDAAVGDLDRTLFLEASAGTGKTTLLVDRVVALVTTGRARMEQIAAITFTEAAAAELRDRLAQRFDQVATDHAADLAAAAAGALDQSAVTTLHGFARRMLTEHPLAVGLPPVFEVADASASRVAFDERWQRFVAVLVREEQHAELVARALSCGMTWRQLRELALAAAGSWERLVAPGTLPSAPAIDASRLRALLDRAVELGTWCAEPADTLATFLESSRRHLAALRDAVGDLDLLQVLAAVPTLAGGRRGQAQRWTRADGSSVKAEILDLLAEAEAERCQVLDQTKQWALRGLLALVVTFTLEAAEERRRTGHLAFHDLLVLARQLMRDDPAARRALHERYTHLLIDEFQDTDPIQVDLALSLAADPAAGDLDGDQWDPSWLSPGRLFFVGDAKQSIYRFRRADIDVFMKTRDRVAAATHTLTTNFRSRPGIVDWVNATFEGLFGAGQPGGQPAYSAIDAFCDQGHDNPAGLRPVIVLGHDAVDGPAAAVRQVQCREVAGAIATMQAEQWPVGADGHALRYRDVTILVRSRTGLGTLEEALRAQGVPYRLESSSLVYQAEEIRQLVAVLRAIDDPADAVSVLAALRSPIFGCGDDDLYAHRVAGLGWDPRRVPAGPGPVAEAMATLSRLHQARWWRRVGELVSDVVAERGLMALALTGARPRESWRRLQFLVDQARLFDESCGGDLRAFLRWVEHQQEEGASVTESILPESDDDAVRISTMHAAKGLEFPVCVLLGVTSAPLTSCPPLLFSPRGPEVCLSRAFESTGYGDALVAERAMDHFEQRRLLYVAATRARDVLVVSLHRPASPTASSSLATDLLEQCAGRPDLWSDGSSLTVPRVPDRASAPRVGAPVFDAESRDRFMFDRTEILARAAIPRTLGATAVRRLAERRHNAAGEPDDGDHDGVETTGGRSRGRAGTAVGRAVHAVLQVVDFESGAGLESLCAAQAVAEGIAERVHEVRDLVRVALDSDVIRRAVEAGTYWREVYVGAPIGARLLEGFIDLLIETPEGLVVVDYKTDRIAADEQHLVVDRYRLQGAAYALALQASLDRPVSRCSFLVLDRTGAHEVVVDDLADAMAEVEELLLGENG
jgi:ATP-dependent exoDNAse (exonuclease V) beta subunit